MPYLRALLIHSLLYIIIVNVICVVPEAPRIDDLVDLFTVEALDRVLDGLVPDLIRILRHGTANHPITNVLLLRLAGIHTYEQHLMP